MSEEIMNIVMGSKEPCKSKPHKDQKRIMVNGYRFYADKEMIPLLKALNKIGLLTYSHCAGHNTNEGNYSDYGNCWLVLDMGNIKHIL